MKSVIAYGVLKMVAGVILKSCTNGALTSLSPAKPQWFGVLIKKRDIEMETSKDGK